MATLTELALKLRPFIEKASIALDDIDALEAIQLFPRWDDSAKYETGDRVRFQNILYKCLQDHIAQPTWSPIVTPSLWAKVLIPDPEVIPEWEQPDSTNAYQIGDKVTFEGKTYECVIANNIWAPNVYGWKEV